MASKDTLTVVYEVTRARGAGSATLAQGIRSLADVIDFKQLSPLSLAASSVSRAIDLTEIGSTAKAIIIQTAQPIGVRINGQSPIRVGSLWFLLDTSITSLALDNNIVSPAAVVQPEIWLARA